jgi:hypothetical protein
MSENAKQRMNVMAVMLDGKFRTLFELDRELRNRGHVYLTTSISARLRELRNSAFGGWIVERRRREGSSERVFEYSLQSPKFKQKELFGRVA